MNQKNIKIIIKEIYFELPKKKYATNKTDVFHNDNNWSLDIIDLKNYGPENNRNYRCVLVVIDIFSNFGCTIPLKNKNAQTIKDCFENVIVNSKRKPDFLESHRNRGFLNSIFQDFSKNINL